MSSLSAVPAFLPAGADLVTDRLVLRSWSSAEVAAVLSGARPAHWADGFPGEGEQVIAGFIAENDGARTAFGQRQIIERASGLVVGAIGLFWPPTDGAVEFGYGIASSRRRRGYATEATRAIVAFALTAPGVRAVFADVEPANPASAGVLKRAGLRRWSGDGGTTRYGTGPVPTPARER